MQNRVSLELFDSWDKVRSEFQISDNMKEPRYVFAYYNYEDYNGDALVVYGTSKKKFFVVEGGHCSCYGLEGQWNPTEHTHGELVKMSKIGERLTGKYYLEWMEHVK